MVECIFSNLKAYLINLNHETYIIYQIIKSLTKNNCLGPYEMSFVFPKFCFPF